MEMDGFTRDSNGRFIKGIHIIIEGRQEIWEISA